MEKITVRVDRQATSLLDISFWSNIVVILIIIGINAVNLLRGGTAQSSTSSSATPQLVIIVSLGLILYMGYISYSSLMTKRRLNKVFVSVDDSGVSGVSLPNPMMAQEGVSFSVPFSQIQSVSLDGAALTKKHTALSLKLEADGQTYVIPAPERLKEIETIISEHLTQKA